jgi:hypothetical protein
MNIELPQFRAELEVEHFEGQAKKHLDIYVNMGLIQKIGNSYYGVGFLTIDMYLQIEDTMNKIHMDYRVKEETLSIKMPERNLFMSLDIKKGIGGDKISENEILVWNGDMMNCSILSLNDDGSINDYEIDLDNNNFDEIEVVGIQQNISCKNEKE